MLVHDYLYTSAQRQPDKIALKCDGHSYSYGQLYRFVNRLARQLVARGIERGDRVVIYIDNGMPAIVSIFAVLTAGAVFSVINCSTKPEKLEFILNHSKARALICDAETAQSMQQRRDRLEHLSLCCMAGNKNTKTSFEPAIHLQSIIARGAQTPPHIPVIDMDLAALIYTSGSTGLPKGVMMTHRNIDSAASSIIHYLQNQPDDVVLNVLPLSFDYGLYQVLMTFKFGGTLILEKSFAYPYQTLTLLNREKVTGFPIVPSMAAILLQMREIERQDFTRVRYISNTGAHLPCEHIARLRRIFPRARIYAMYGLTECKRVSYLPPAMLNRKPGSVGRGMPNEEVYLVDESGNRLPPGSTGELVVRGANVMQGYWQDPEETDKRLRPGGRYPWEKVLYTGDLFRMDKDGYLYFIARKDDIIKSRGEKVSPKEIENVIYRIPQVAEAAVVGIPDAVLGEAIKAFVVPIRGSELDSNQIKRHCAAHLENFMVPQQVEICSELPKTTSGKIKKTDLLQS
ncbi:AMP-binding protein [candidate division KSB1 bacterium]|nr:AMP-binding protein [candidate division KSB1 bacterium]